MTNDTIWSVVDLSDYIQAKLEFDDRLQQVWLTGEVTSANNHPRGIFFTLSDPEKAAAIRCVVWQNQRSRLAQIPTVGEQLLVLGSLRVFTKRGEYQLNVFQALPAGEGLQALLYRQLRDRLEKEGLFDPAKKRPLPAYPQTVAVVTSAKAAAWGDIKRTIQQRYPGLTVLLSPAIVQGEQAPSSIARAITRVEKDGRAEVLILARGGGATEDLQCFNDEKVVRAIAACSLPIITGIGHQRDESLADLAADACAHTPTAAAETVVPNYNRLYAEHKERKAALVACLQRRWQQELDKLQRLRDRLQRLPANAPTVLRATAQCQSLQAKLAALDPYAVLRRGYAVAQLEDGTLVRNSEELEIGQSMAIALGRGKVKVKVIEILE